MFEAQQIIAERYLLQQKLGDCSIRQTWLAIELITDNLVIIKLLAFGDRTQWQDLKLFEREAQLVKRKFNISVRTRGYYINDIYKQGYTNSSQEMVVPAVFDYVPKQFNGDRQIVKFQNKWGVIDKEGKSIVPFIFDAIDKSATKSDLDYVTGTIDGKTCITDLSGNTIVPFEF